MAFQFRDLFRNPNSTTNRKGSASMAKPKFSINPVNNLLGASRSMNSATSGVLSSADKALKTRASKIQSPNYAIAPYAQINQIGAPAQNASRESNRSTMPQQDKERIQASMATPGSNTTVETPNASVMDQLMREQAMAGSGNRNWGQDVAFTQQAMPDQVPTPEAPVTPPDDTGAEFSQQMMQQPTAPSATSQRAALEQALLESMQPSQEELALQQELADLRSAATAGSMAEEGAGRGRTLGLVRGRQEKLLGQAQNQEANLLDRLAIEQAKRTAANQAAQAQLQMAQQQEQLQAQRTAPIEFGGNLVRLNPATGEYETVLEGPQATPEPVVLKPGDILYDPTTGQPMFQAPAAPGSGQPKVQKFGEDYYQWDSTTNQWTPTQINKPVSPEEQQKVNDIVSIANELLNDPALGRAVGPLSSRTPTLRGDRADFEGKVNRLKSLLTLGNLGLMSGVLSETDIQILQSAASSLDTSMSEEGFKEELGRIINQFSTALSNPQGSQDVQIYQQLLNEGAITPEEYQAIIGSFSNDLGMSGNGLGSLSERYESGGDPGAIGYDSTGGLSYGAYQLAHNNAQQFIANSPYKQYFQGIPFNSQQWQQRWKEVAQADPNGFKEAQKQYIKLTHFDPQVNKLQRAGINVNQLNPVVQDAIWSTAVQHGPNTDIVLNALRQAGNDPRQQLQAIYNQRWAGGANFRSSTPQVQQSVQNRFFGPQGELNLALSRLNQTTA